MPYLSILDNWELSSITETDFTKGFLAWHVKWHIGNISPAAMRMRRTSAVTSDDFKMVIEASNMFIEWRLAARYNDGDSLILIANPSFTDKSPPFPLPAIIRYGWSNGNDNIIFNDARFIAFTSAYSPDYDDLVEHKLPSTQSADDFTFHCWIAIPNIDWGERMEKNINQYDAAFFEYRCIKKVTSNFAALFDGVLGKDDKLKSTSDITLAVLEQGSTNVVRQFYCHRGILMTGSSIFMAMFSGKWMESRDKVIEITEIDEKTMESVLRFIYTGETPSNQYDFAEVKNILNTAEKYDLPELKQWAEAHFILRVNTDRERIEYLQLADRYRLDQFKAVCVAALSTNTAQLENQNVWGTIPQQILQKITSAAGGNMWNTKHICLGTQQRKHL